MPPFRADGISAYGVRASLMLAFISSSSTRQVYHKHMAIRSVPGRV